MLTKKDKAIIGMMFIVLLKGIVMLVGIADTSSIESHSKKFLDEVDTVQAQVMKWLEE